MSDSIAIGEAGHASVGVAAATETVRSARDAYLAENGFTTEEYVADTFRLKLFGRVRELPNRPDRKWAIPLHDLHHVATGYGTDFVGEAEIGAWELAAGCKTTIVYALNVVATLIGLFLAPRRVIAAAFAGRHARALYRQTFELDTLLASSVGELRARLGIPNEGLARHPRRLHAGVEEARRHVAEGHPPSGG